MDILNNLSQNQERNSQYQALIKVAEQNKLTVQQLALKGSKIMQAFQLHPHYFGDNSLYMNALYLIFFSLDLPRETQYFSNQSYLQKKISPEQTQSILKLYEQRIVERIPVEYITHEAFYLNYNFYVNKNVLVPRSLMNTRFQDFLDEVTFENYRILDLCAGSGCIGISLALLNPKIQVDLADISIEALKVAQINIEKYRLTDRVRCIQSDLFKNISEKFDLIISNPPYVPDDEYQRQPSEICHEPAEALKGGGDGLDIIRKIIAQSKAHLNKEGLLIAEVGYTSARNIKRQYSHIPFKWFSHRVSQQKDSLYEILLSFCVRIIDRYLPWLHFPCLDSIFICKAKDLPDN